MIVRERLYDFSLIEQHDHAHISGTIATNWVPALFRGTANKSSVEYAIFNHDIGWVPFDAAPFWDDHNQIPYSFISFPLQPKLTLYKHGIDQIEKVDEYAALLCSYHYTSFIKKVNNKFGQTFVQEEKTRQNKIKNRIYIDHDLFEFHYGLLQFCDHLSLYICLNEPGTAKSDEHHFFKNGIPAHSALQLSHFKVQWLNEQTVSIDPFPFIDKIEVSLKQRIITKETIQKSGILHSFQNTSPQVSTIQIISC